MYICKTNYPEFNRNTLFIPEFGNYFFTATRLKYCSKMCNVKNVQIEKNVKKI